MQLCPDGVDELQHLRFADPSRSPIPLETALNSMSLIHVFPIQAAAIIIMTAEVVYVLIVWQAYDTMVMLFSQTRTGSLPRASVVGM